MEDEKSKKWKKESIYFFKINYMHEKKEFDGLNHNSMIFFLKYWFVYNIANFYNNHIINIYILI